METDIMKSAREHSLKQAAKQAEELASLLRTIAKGEGYGKANREVVGAQNGALQSALADAMKYL